MTHLIITCYKNSSALRETLHKHPDKEPLSQMGLLEQLPNSLRPSGFEVQLLVDLKIFLSREDGIWIVFAQMQLHEHI